MASIADLPVLTEPIRPEPTTPTVRAEEEEEEKEKASARPSYTPTVDDFRQAMGMVTSPEVGTTQAPTGKSHIGQALKGFWDQVKGEPARFLAGLDRMATSISKATGLEKGGLFENLKKTLTPDVMETGDPDDIAYRVGRIIGGTATGVTELMAAHALRVPMPAAMGGLGAFHAYAAGGGPKEVVTEGLLGAGIGKTYKALAPASRFIRAPALGAAGVGAETISTLVREGRLPTKEELAESGLTQFAFGFISGPGDAAVTRRLYRKGWTPEDLRNTTFEQRLAIYRSRTPAPTTIRESMRAAQEATRVAPEEPLTAPTEVAPGAQPIPTEVAPPTRPTPPEFPVGLEAWGADLYEGEVRPRDITRAQEATQAAVYAKYKSLTNTLVKRGFDPEALDLLNLGDLEFLIKENAKPKDYIIDLESLSNPEKVGDQWKLVVKKAGKFPKKPTLEDLEAELRVTLDANRASELREQVSKLREAKARKEAIAGEPETAEVTEAATTPVEPTEQILRLRSQLAAERKSLTEVRKLLDVAKTSKEKTFVRNSLSEIQSRIKELRSEIKEREAELKKAKIAPPEVTKAPEVAAPAAAPEVPTAPEAPVTPEVTAPAVVPPREAPAVPIAPKEGVPIEAPALKALSLEELNRLRDEQLTSRREWQDELKRTKDAADKKEIRNTIIEISRNIKEIESAIKSVQESAKKARVAKAPKVPKVTEAPAEVAKAEEAVPAITGKTPADVKALMDLGYSESQIRRLKPELVDRIIGEKLPASDVSVLRSGNISILRKTPEAVEPRPEAKVAEPIPVAKPTASEPEMPSAARDIAAREEQIRNLRIRLGEVKAPLEERKIGTKIVEPAKLTEKEKKDIRRTIAELQQEIEEIKKAEAAGKYVPETELPEPTLPTKDSSQPITEAEKRMLIEDFGLKEKEIRNWNRGQLETFLADVGYEKPVTRTKKPIVEKSDAELLKEQGVADEDVLKALLTKYETPEPPPIAPFTPTESVDAAEIVKKASLGTKSSSQALTKEANTQAAAIRNKILSLEADKKVLEDYIREDMKPYLEKDEIARVSQEIADITKELVNLRKSLNDIVGIRKEATSEAKSKAGVDPYGLAVHDAKKVRSVQFGDVGANISIFRDSPKTHYFNLLSSREGKIPTPDTEPVIRGEAKVTFDNKGNPTLVKFNVDSSLDPKFADQLYDAMLELYGGRGKTLKVHPDAAGTLDPIIKRRTPIERQDPVYMSSTFGFFTNPEAYVKTYNDLKDVVKHAKQAITYLIKSRREIDLDKEYLKYKRGMALRNMLTMKDTIDTSLLQAERATHFRLSDLMNPFDLLGDITRSTNPTMRYIGQLGEMMDMMRSVTRANAREYIEKYLGWMRNDEKAKQEFTLQMAGIRKATDPRVIASFEKYRALMNDYANVAELKERGMFNTEYGTVEYDMNKLYNWYKKPIMAADSYEKLPEVYQAYVDPTRFDLIKSIIMKHEAAGHTVWDDLPELDKGILQQNLFNWSNAFSAYEFLPLEVQMKLPKEKWNAYFQKRTHFVAPGLTREQTLELFMKSDPFEIIDNYINATTNAIAGDWFLKRARPIINTLPGPSYPVTKRGYLDRYTKMLVFGKKASDVDMLWNTVAREINSNLFGENVLPLYLPTRVANAFIRGMYRGTLGPDTALRNLTQSLNTIVESGKFPVFSALKARIEGSKEWEDFSKLYSIVGEFDPQYKRRLAVKGEKFETIKNADKTITDLALRPMGITEKINKFMQYMAGLEEAKKLGLDFDNAHLVGLERAFTTIENPALTEAQWYAWRKVWATQFGYTPAHSSPFLGTNPLARMSTVFWSYPIKTLQLWRTGIMESALAGDNARLARYMALVGFSLTAPFWFGAVTGLNVEAMYGKGLLPYQITPTWLNLVKDAYAAVGGDVSAYEEDRATENFKHTIAMITIPWYRFGRKVVNSYENAQRGYVEYGQTGHPLVETNDFKEICNLFGFPPESTASARKAYREIRDEEIRHRLQKTKYLDKMAKHLEEGDMNSVTDTLIKARQDGFMLTYSDVMDRLRYRQQSAWEVLRKQAPTERRGEFTTMVEEETRTHLPTFKKGARPLWSSAD